MRKVKKCALLLLTLSLVIGSLYSGSWAQQDEWAKHDPIVDEWNLLDTFIVRPLSVLAGIAGTGFFIASLPFTVPTRSVDGAAERLIVEPFKFSFTRKPIERDQDIFYHYYY